MKHALSLFIVSMSAAILSPSFSEASQLPKIYGAVSGGGGKGLICQAGNPQIVELLDLWEARTLFAEPIQKSSLKVEDRVDELLIALRDAYIFQGSGIGENGTNYQDQDFVLALLRKEAARFLKTDAKVLRLRDVTLELTEDSFEAARPAGCDIQQIVNYQPNGRVLINQDLFDKLDSTNQAALIAHESFYSFLRMMDGERSSIRTRRAIGYVASGKQFTLKLPNLVGPTVTCASMEAPLARNRWVFAAAAVQPAGFGLINAALTQNEGARPLGLDAGTFDFSVAQPIQNIADAFTGRCKGEPGKSMYEDGVLLSGPIEFDRSVKLFWVCEQQVLSLYQQTVTSDGGTSPWIKLQCQ